MLPDLTQLTTHQRTVHLPRRATPGRRAGLVALSPLSRRRRQPPSGWDDGCGLPPALMYTDWTAVILLLLTAAPLAVVVATAAFFIWRKKKLKG